MESQTKKPRGVADDLACNLMLLASAYAQAKRLRLSMVGVHVRNDQRFFTDKVSRGAFTVAVYDATIAWFDAHWPDGAVWPKRVARH